MLNTLLKIANGNTISNVTESIIFGVVFVAIILIIIFVFSRNDDYTDWNNSMKHG